MYHPALDRTDNLGSNRQPSDPTTEFVSNVFYRDFVHLCFLIKYFRADKVLQNGVTDIDDIIFNGDETLSRVWHPP